MQALVRPGCEISRERTARRVARHHHLGGYAALVLRGGYLEAGDRGRFRAAPGDVLLHDRFEAHQDHFDSGGADILNLPLVVAPAPAFGRVDDADLIVRLAAHDARAAAEALLAAIRTVEAVLSDWPDLLAAELRGETKIVLGCWARAHGLSPSGVSRGFRQCYGVSPQRYRAEHRAALAARAAQRVRSRTLAHVAAATGFADQAHMTRTIRRLYGRTPSAIRGEAGKCVQDGVLSPL
jgi:AraC-like DNA-binding protein